MVNSVRRRYCEFLNTQQGASVYKSFKDYLYGENDSLIQVLNNEILQNLKFLGNKQLEICDIGGGDGHRIKHILKFINNRFGFQLKIDFIEQSKILIDSFDTLPINSFCETNKIHGLFEKTSSLQKYDIIFLVHSIFALDNGRSMDKIISLRKDGGRIIVLSNAADSFLAGLKFIVDDDYQDKRYEISDFRNSLKNREIEFFTFYSKTEWAISKSDYQNFLSVLLEWITLGRYNSYAIDKKDLILKYIEGHRKEKLNQYLFMEKEEILIIPSFP